MALLENGFLKMGGSIALGVGAIVLAPIIVPAVSAVVRPLVKAGIKSAMVLYQKGTELATEASETLGDLVEEVKAEVVSE